MVNEPHIDAAAKILSRPSLTSLPTHHHQLRLLDWTNNEREAGVTKGEEDPVTRRITRLACSFWPPRAM